MRYLSVDTMNQIISYVDGYYKSNGYTPTIAEISSGLSLAAGTVHKYLHRMNESGQLSFDGRHIITPYIENHTSKLSAPVSGAIACGTPGFAEQEFGEEIILPASLAGSGEFFVLRAKGYSMINIGIEPGDLVVMRRQNYADEGDIVAALIGEETTLKRYTLDRANKKIVLVAENDDKNEYADQIYNEITVQGVAVYVMKKVGG